LILLWLSGLTAAFSQDGTADIRTVLADQVKEWNNGSVEGYMKGYWNSDSTMFVSGGNVTRGYGNVLSRYKKAYDTREKMGKLEFSELAIRKVSSGLAIATGAWQLTRTYDKLGGRFTLIIEKKPEGWRIVYDHTSSAK
jgi:ketosteroid isomerase-like protein